MIQKLSDNDSAKTGLLEKADSIMQALLGVFQCHAGSVHEEAMLAVGALTYACGQSFTKYMQSFYPILKLGLENHRVRLLKLMFICIFVTDVDCPVRSSTVKQHYVSSF